MRVLAPRSFSMEQVPHPTLKALLHERGIAFTVVDAIDYGVPQHRKRLIAGSPRIVAALEERRGSLTMAPALRPVPRLEGQVRMNPRWSLCMKSLPSDLST